MPYCCAYNCKNRSSHEAKISFHKFPLENKDLCKRWAIAVRRVNFTPNVHTRICSQHFTADDYYANHSKPSLKPDSVPSVFNFPKNLIKVEPMRRNPKIRETTTIQQLNTTTEVPLPTQAPDNPPTTSENDVLEYHNYAVSGSPRKMKKLMENLNRMREHLKLTRKRLHSSKALAKRQKMEIGSLKDAITHLKVQNEKGKTKRHQ